MYDNKQNYLKNILDLFSKNQKNRFFFSKVFSAFRKWTKKMSKIQKLKILLRKKNENFLKRMLNMLF